MSIGRERLLDAGDPKTERLHVKSWAAWEADSKGRAGFRPGSLANGRAPADFTPAAVKSRGLALESSSDVLSNHTLLYPYVGAGPVYTPDMFPTDWTGYAFLRMDVRAEHAELVMRMAFEDDKVAPPIERRYTVPAGTWSTLQIDLEAAARERGVDLARIENFWLFLEETAAPTLVYFDNVRLSRKEAKARHPVLEGGPKRPRPVAEMPAFEVANPASGTRAPFVQTVP